MLPLHSSVGGAAGRNACGTCQNDSLRPSPAGGGTFHRRKAPKAKGKCYRHLPGPTMVPVALDDLFPFDDDRRGVIARRTHLHHLLSHPAKDIADGLLPAA